MRRTAQVIALLLALFIVAGCGAQTKAPDSSTPDTGGTESPSASGDSRKEATIAMWSAPNDFNPFNTDSSYGYFAVDIMFDTLAAMNHEGEYVPKLATDWVVSPDYSVYTFHIHPDAKWHDGQPVTAEDVAFSFNIIAHPDTVTNRSANISLIAGTDVNGKSDGSDLEGVRVVDEKTVEFTLKQAADPLGVLEKLGTAIRIVPKHILGDTAPADLGQHELFRNPTVGNGPFKFVKYVTDQYIEYERNDDYHLGQPKLERLFLRIMPATSAVAALEKGEIDLTAGAGIGEIPLQDWEKVKSLDNIEAVSFVTRGYQYMDLNHRREFFADPRVRQALHYGINRRLMVDNLLQGEGTVLETPYTPIFKYVNENLEFREHDPEKARQLLTEAGWDFNQEVELLVPTGNRAREQSADIIMANLQEVGMKIKIQKLDFATMQARRRAADYDMALVGWSSLLDPDVSSQYRTGGAYNAGGYSNPKIDELLDKGVVTAEYNERKAIYDEFQQVHYDDPAYVILYSPYGLTAVSKRMVNVTMSAHNILANLHEWDVK